MLFWHSTKLDAWPCASQNVIRSTWIACMTPCMMYFNQGFVSYKLVVFPFLSWQWIEAAVQSHIDCLIAGILLYQCIEYIVDHLEHMWQHLLP